MEGLGATAFRPRPTADLLLHKPAHLILKRLIRLLKDSEIAAAAIAVKSNSLDGDIRALIVWKDLEVTVRAEAMKVAQASI